MSLHLPFDSTILISFTFPVESQGNFGGALDMIGGDTLNSVDNVEPSGNVSSRCNLVSFNGVLYK